MVEDRSLIRRSLVASFALYVVFGLPDGVFGTIWPNLRDHFGRTDSSLGLVISCLAIGYATGSVSSGHLAERLGIGRLLPMAMTAATIALAAVAAAPHWWMVAGGYLALGLGWGIADAGINAWMALTQGPRQMGLLHACYGIGAFLGPLLATAFVADNASWRAPYVVCVVLSVGAVIGLTRARIGFAAAPTSIEVTNSRGGATGTNGLLVLMISWFAVYVGLEVSVGSWSFTLLTEGRGESDVTAGILAATFWGGLMAGRFALAVFGERLHPERTMWTSTVLASAGTFWMWADPAGRGWVALPVIGIALSMMFPVMIGRTAVYLGEERATRAVGYQIGASSVGFTVLPAFIGVLADRYGVDWAAPVFTAIALVAGVLLFAITRTTAPARRGAPVSRSGS